jgi:predicted NBD/HSP70 family sugar kinase
MDTRRAVEQLTAALVSLINILHPDIILMGHQASYFPAPLLQYTESRVNVLRYSDTDPLLHTLRRSCAHVRRRDAR